MPVPRSVATLSASAVPELGSYDLLIYDGECRFCQAQVVRMQRWAGAQILPIPLQRSGLLEALGIPHEEAMAAMQLVTRDGRIHAGVEAVVQGLRHRPILGRLLLLYYVPGCRHLADLGYRWVARYRYRLMGRAIARGECDGGSCALHPEPK